LPSEAERREGKRDRKVKKKDGVEELPQKRRWKLKILRSPRGTEGLGPALQL